jgi:putative transposase
LLDQADQVFGRGGSSPSESEHKLKELHAKIGQLTMERDFLEQGLERIHGPRGKKMIDRSHSLPVTRQCQLLGLNR